MFCVKGDPLWRPQSELKAMTPVDKPPLPPSFAPPEIPRPNSESKLKIDKLHILLRVTSK